MTVWLGGWLLATLAPCWDAFAGAGAETCAPTASQICHGMLFASECSAVHFDCNARADTSAFTVPFSAAGNGERPPSDPQESLPGATADTLLFSSSSGVRGFTALSRLEDLTSLYLKLLKFLE